MFPTRLLKACDENVLSLDAILGCGLPWLKLDINGPDLATTIINEAIESSSCWSTHQNLPQDYQLHDWNGQFLFGPKDLPSWHKLKKNDQQKNDEDALCMMHLIR